MKTVQAFKQLHDSSTLKLPEYCLACRDRGKEQILRSYQISFQESILLCENPQCIFPLGYAPLSATLTPVVQTGSSKFQSCGIKRKSWKNSPVSPVKNTLKRCRRSSSQARTEQLLSNTTLGQLSSNTTLGLGTEQSSSSALIPASERLWSTASDLCPEKSWSTNLNVVPGYDGDSRNPCLPPGSNVSDQTDPNVAICRPGDDFSRTVDCGSVVVSDMACEKYSTDNKLHFEDHQLEEVPPVKTSSAVVHRTSTDRCVRMPLYIQWKNKYALCWLDCILVALVLSRKINEYITKRSPEDHSLIWKLVTEYNSANDLLKSCQKGVKDKIPLVPVDILEEAESHLSSIRENIYNVLQPKLKCTLGKYESPVFALPLILKEDPQIEKLFLHFYTWKFECSDCGYNYNDRCSKTLTSFTTVTPDWHPLNAVHVSPCNNCHNKYQRRTMNLNNVSSIFMLHFVEGLPRDDLKFYSFCFEDGYYEITTVIQYHARRKHFATWVSSPDGTWLEFDDLKGPDCFKHDLFKVPTEEIHIVIWERSSFAGVNSSPITEHASTLSLTALPVSCSNLPRNEGKTVVPGSQKTFSTFQMPLVSSGSAVQENKCNSLLSGLEGLADDAVVTLTLVEIKVDSDGKPLGNEQTLQKENTDMSSVCGKDFSLPADSVRQPENTSVPGESAEKHAVTVKQQGKLPRNQKCSQVQNKQTSLHAVGTSVSAPSSVTFPSAISQHHSAASHSVEKDKKKGFGTTLMKSLLSRHPSFVPSSSVSLKHNKTDVGSLRFIEVDTHPFKEAKTFVGFEPKGIRKKSEAKREEPLSRKPVSSAAAPAPRDPFPNVNPGTSENEVPVVKTGGGLLTNVTVPATSDCSLHPLSKHNKSETSRLGDENGDLDAKTHKLRLKLMKKLKAKKERLASLDHAENLQQEEVDFTDGLGSYLRTAENEHAELQGILRDLQNEIDIADIESICTMSSTASISSSSSDAEFFAELFSPATMCVSPDVLSGKQSNVKFTQSADSNSSINPANCWGATTGSDMYNPSNGAHSFSSAQTSYLSYSETKEDLISDLLSGSTLSTFPEDLPHFDENLFEHGYL
ncbi:SUMO-specific isopeptidase USPL1 isoform X1 [Protopterus annectens]|uniref:SUMO-specific isopeptidase USPL1 isoform X1 n=1 Tax=Protopterus annectens TaxID=7888 RepID=UPI001CFA5512|nr:SUMO-specific isopeptidase USPL1 isoform X1 [Protopterus annectens]XP_043929181.1 SUMO-specific isopeptidase USPL1 isoform X1 [Protopterus annectens]